MRSKVETGADKPSYDLGMPLPEQLQEPRVIILNGPPGVGKSTVGRSLAARSDKGICIHGDHLGDDGPADCHDGARLASGFIAGGYQLVVFERCFTDPRGLRQFQDAYLGAAPLFFYTLWAELDNAQRRDEFRDSKEPLSPDLAEIHTTMAADLEGLAPIVYADVRTVSEVIDDILLRCSLGHGRVISTLYDQRAYGDML